MAKFAPSDTGSRFLKPPSGASDLETTFSCAASSRRSKLSSDNSLAVSPVPDLAYPPLSFSKGDQIKTVLIACCRRIGPGKGLDCARIASLVYPTNRTTVSWQTTKSPNRRNSPGASWAYCSEAGLQYAYCYRACCGETNWPREQRFPWLGRCRAQHLPARPGSREPF